MGRRILCYGDSNTYGYDPRSYLGGRYPETVRWTSLLGRDGYEVINEGENGRCIPRADDEITAVVQSLRRSEAEMLIVMLGSNDLLRRPVLGAEGCVKRMESFLTALSNYVSSSLKILLAAPPPMKPGTWINDPKTLDESIRLADCYAELAERLGIRFEDTGAWNVPLAFDGVHFSEEGNRAFAEGMRRALGTCFFDNTPL